MKPQATFELFNQLSQEKQEIVLLFVQFLSQNKEKTPQNENAWKAGCLKSDFWMSDDFDEPLEDFKDYM